jgi:hypothetical protein
MQRRNLVVAGVILAVLVLAIYQGTGMGRSWQTVPAPTIAAALTPVPTVATSVNYEDYTNKKMGYTIAKPAGWSATPIADTTNFDDRQVFMPDSGTKLGNFSEISVTVVSKPAKTAELSSAEEYNKWLTSPNEATDSSGLVVKRGEKMVQGNRAVVLWQDKSLPDGYDWSIMTWVRRGEVNYYIDALGTGQYSDLESRVFDQVAGSFKIKE